MQRTELSAYYAARAAEYERIYEKPERQEDLAELRRLIPDYFAGRTVLEIACGTGYWTQFIAPRARHITAIDINAETLAIARSKAFPAGRVTFEIGDVHRLPARSQPPTAAFAGFWWSHMRRTERNPFLASLHRALRPGAIVVFLDNLYVPGSSTPIYRIDTEGNSFQRRELSDGSEHIVLKNFPAEAELRADVAPWATNVEYTALKYYWLVKFEIAAE